MGGHLLWARSLFRPEMTSILSLLLASHLLLVLLAIRFTMDVSAP